jgi:hypothetical protein
LKARGLNPNDALVRQTRVFVADDLLKELDTPEGLADLLPVIPSILEQEKFPVADDTELDPSATNLTTFRAYLEQFGASNRYASEVMLRPLLRSHGESAIVIKVDGQGVLQGIFEAGDGGPLNRRIYLVNVLSGEPNEHFAALLPLWRPPRSAPASSPSPAPHGVTTSGAPPLRRGRGRLPKSLEEKAAEYPWAAAVEGKPDRYYCIWCEEHSGVQTGWGQKHVGVKITVGQDLKKHLQHFEGGKWVDGNPKHDEAKVIYDRARGQDAAPCEGVDLPLMSAKAKTEFRDVIMAVSKVAYFIGEYELPFSLARPLCDLIAQCAQHAKTLATVDKYQNKDQVIAITEHMGVQVQKRMLDAVRSAPLYALGFDESTDNGGRQNLVIIVSWLDRETFSRKEAFLRLKDLQGQASGENLATTLLDFVDASGLDRG